MTDFFNAYDILGVKRDDSIVVIKKAWMLARSKSHPDRGGKPEDFKKYKKAWEILSVKSSRESHNLDIDWNTKKQSQEQSTKTNESYSSYKNEDDYATYSNPSQKRESVYSKAPSILYEIHANFSQIVDIIARGGYCQFSMDGETVRGTIQIEQGTLLKHGKIYPFMSYGVRYNVKLTWDWNEPWVWDDKHGQVHYIEMTEANIRKGGKEQITLPTGQLITFGWKPLAETATLKNGLWVKLKKQGWPTAFNDEPNAWVHLIPVSGKNIAKKKMKNIGNIFKGMGHEMGAIFNAMPTFMWRAMAIVAGLYALTWFMKNADKFHF